MKVGGKEEKVGHAFYAEILKFKPIFSFRQTQPGKQNRFRTGFHLLTTNFTWTGFVGGCGPVGEKETASSHATMATLSLLSPQLIVRPRRSKTPNSILLSDRRSNFINFLSNSHNPTKVFLRSRSGFAEEEEADSSNSSSRFEGAIELFNAMDYYACHDVLESMWYSSNDQTRTLLHGLLQCAVGFHHLFNQNHKGAMMELGEGLCKLRRLDFEGGPFHQFEREITDVLEFIYQTQLELAACSEDMCISMEQTERSYQLLGSFAAKERIYDIESNEEGNSYIVFNPASSYGATNPPRRTRLPKLQAKMEHLKTLSI